jgi:hypothetical protein
MNKSSSRIPAPAVATVVVGGVRYEQVPNGLLAGFDQMGGYLVAVDVTSGTPLWTLQVYDNQRVPGREGDVQDVFFKSMAAQRDGTLLVENERGRRFVVDPATRSVTAAVRGHACSRTGSRPNRLIFAAVTGQGRTT